MSKQVSTLGPVYEKKKELEVLVAKLHDDAIKKQGEYRAIVEAADAVEERIKNAEKLGVDVASMIDESIELLKKVLSRAEETMNGIEKVIDAGIAIFQKLDEEIGKKEQRIEALKVEEGERLRHIAERNGQLSVRERDLDIYKHRLEKKYIELGMGELIL